MRSKLYGALALLLLALGVGWNWMMLTEAYGSGPPYYGRTTNMDKWADPLPWLGIIDLVLLAVIGLLIWAARHASARTRTTAKAVR